ncbi:hypothetical protein SCOR_03580 [Sulfidibacter corallicola]|uniref:Uncharacterized protein n=1 Tax=Sulfidibacter corallicola TaxID=2818388 RepID=A0A8A4THU5_SULCO|nr:hypothetical protein [Sulfidibacter corallicola]QTD48391.1 hypothetical protein J3U87_22655 [Sulfidibacter corallicola]
MTVTVTKVPDAQRNLFLRQLHGAAFYPGTSKRALSRLLWRAGEYGFAEAGTSILEALKSRYPMVLYCGAWAAGRCEIDGARTRLDSIQRTQQLPDYVRFMAGEAWRHLLTPDEKATLRDRGFGDLPAWFREVCQEPDSFVMRFREMLSQQAGFHHAALIWDLYRIDDPEDRRVRHCLLAALTELPLRPPLFRFLRRIFKAAIFRGDAEVFGILAYRFEVERAQRVSGWGWVTDGPQVFKVRLPDEFAKDGCKIGFLSSSKDYLRRASWRTLKRMAETDGATYVRFAAELLRHYRDEDGKEPRSYRHYDGIEETWHEVVADRFAACFLMNQVIYGRSPRYRRPPGRLHWRCRGDWVPGDAPPDVREEAFPELWDQRPDLLRMLLLRGRCHRVHQFAAKALADRADTTWTLQDLVALLNGPFPETRALGFHLVRHRHADLIDEPEIATALLLCPEPEAHRLALDRAPDPSWPAGHPTVVVRWALSTHRDVRRACLDWLATNPLQPDFAEHILHRLTVRLASGLSGTLETAWARDVAAIVETLGERVEATGDLARAGFAPSETVALEMMDHPCEDVGRLALRLLARFAATPESLSDGFWMAVWRAEDRYELGLDLLGRLPDSALLRHAAALVFFCRDSRAAVRERAGLLLDRLYSISPECRELAVQLLCRDLLRAPDSPEAHQARLEVLCGPLQCGLVAVDDALLRRLLAVPHAAAHRLAAQIIRHFRDVADFEERDLVRLADHVLPELRVFAASAALQWFEPETRRCSAVWASLLDSEWEDTFEFATALFEELLAEGKLSADAWLALPRAKSDRGRDFSRRLLDFALNDVGSWPHLVELANRASGALLERIAVRMLAEVDRAPKHVAEFGPVMGALLTNRAASGTLRRRALEPVLDGMVGGRLAPSVGWSWLNRLQSRLPARRRGELVAALAAKGLVWAPGAKKKSPPFGLMVQRVPVPVRESRRVTT